MNSYCRSTVFALIIYVIFTLMNSGGSAPPFEATYKCYMDFLRSQHVTYNN